MTATEMHDLLSEAFTFVEAQDLFRPGVWPGFENIQYCRFCSFSTAHVAEHGHGEACLYRRLKAATHPSAE